MNATESLELPLKQSTPQGWARLAKSNLDVFLADHALCEMQASLTALSLIAHYPEDEELVERMTSLAIEEASHLRKVTELMRKRSIKPAKRRGNPYVQALKSSMRKDSEATLKLDRLFVCALIEARSCERFTCLLAVTQDDAPLVALLEELGPAEKRHWKMFYKLAQREADKSVVDTRWEEWLTYEAEVMEPRGVAPTVHG